MTGEGGRDSAISESSIISLGDERETSGVSRMMEPLLVVLCERIQTGIHWYVSSE